MAEAETIETKKCSTCERDIEASKFRMHEIGCARMNYKCKECGEVVAKADREEHEEQDCPITGKKAKEEEEARQRQKI